MGEKNNCLTLVSPAIVVSMWNTKRPLLVKCVPLTQCVLSRLANVCSWTWYFLHYDIEETWITHIFLIIFDFPLKLALYSTNNKRERKCFLVNLILLVHHFYIRIQFGVHAVWADNLGLTVFTDEWTHYWWFWNIYSTTNLIAIQHCFLRGLQDKKSYY